jgi:hypothetical protein
MPTYRNDGTLTHRINDIADLPQMVIPGASVETYDRNVPSDFTLTNSLPSLQRTIHAGSGEDVWTGSINPRGYFNVSVSGQFTGIVRLERSFDNFVSIEKTMDIFTNSLEDNYTDPDPNAKYRLGVREGELTVGMVEVILSK